MSVLFPFLRTLDSFPAFGFSVASSWPLIRLKREQRSIAGGSGPFPGRTVNSARVGMPTKRGGRVMSAQGPVSSSFHKFISGDNAFLCLHNSRKRLGIERLESRCMLSGNVTANVSGGYLTVRGDSNGNNISINGTATSGQLVIEGFNRTTVNGTASFTVNGATNGIRVTFLDGSDNLVVGGNIGGNVSVGMGDGENDAVEIEGSAVGQSLSISLGMGKWRRGHRGPERHRAKSEHRRGQRRLATKSA